MKTTVGQVFLTHPGKDKNFVSIYEEAFSKHGQDIELFAVIEVADVSSVVLKNRKKEYDKLAQSLVNAFKKAYITSPLLDEDVFEQALSAINATLSQTLSKGSANWYNKLNVVVAAIFRNTLYLSVCGSAMVHLMRKNELTVLSDGLSEETRRPIKFFVNYANGKIAPGDKIILTTKEIFNYLSLTRLGEYLSNDAVKEACQEIINTLNDTKDMGFATFIAEVSGAIPAQVGAPTRVGEEKISVYAPSGSPSVNTYPWLRLIKTVATWLLKAVWQILTVVLGSVFAFLAGVFTRRRGASKKYVLIAVALVILVLLINIGAAFLNKRSKNQQTRHESILQEIDHRLSEAEAALIYEDEERTLSLVLEAEKLLTSRDLDKGDEEKIVRLTERLLTFKSKIVKETIVDNPKILTTFPSIPTDLLYSKNGILGFNRSSNTLSFYDFRSGETKGVLKNQNTSRLLLGSFVGDPFGFVFLTREGKFTKLNLNEDTTLDIPAENPLLQLETAKIEDLAALGEGLLARFYALDTRQNQIWRMRVISETEISKAEKWLKEEVNLAEAKDLAIDGNIYIIIPNSPEKILKYFNGTRQTFKVSKLAPELSEPQKILAGSNLKFLYLLDPKNERVVILRKDGKLERQIRSPKFRALSDLYADEANNLLYLLAGNELLQVSF